MKRALIISLIVLFCAAAFGFNYFGEDIRDALAPRVEAVKIKYSIYGVVVPSEAVRTDESGQTYVMFAVKTDKYPEKGYEALRLDCDVVDTTENEVVLSIAGNADIDYLAIVSADKEVIEERRVVVVY